MGLQFIGLGRGMPGHIATNDELATLMDTSDEWIRARTGIQTRRIIMDESLDDLIETAAREAMAQASVTAQELDLIIVASVTPASMVPSSACTLQGRLGATCPAFDINAACSGFVYAMHIAQQFFLAGSLRYVLIVGAEALSRVTNWKDRSSCILFGDGAGAAVMGDGGCDGIQHSQIEAFGEHSAEALHIGGVDFTDYPLSPKRQRKHAITMDGRVIFDFAVRTVTRGIKRMLDACNWRDDQLNWAVPHQANNRIIQAVAQKTGIPFERFFMNIEQYGNTSSATIPLCLYDMRRDQLVKSGDRILLLAFGGGLTAASAGLIW